VGDSVQAGQLLAKMDSVEYEARMVEAQQNLERSQAEYNRAVRAREEAQRRGVPLVITDDVFDTLSATKGVQEQLVRIAEQRLKDTRLIAPVNGKISARYKAAGELVNANEPVFEIVEVDQLLLVVGVPESRIHEIRLGQTVYIDRHATDYFGRKFALLEGTVHKVAAAAHESTGWFDIEVIVDNSNGELKPGLIADARIVIDELQGVRLPQHAAVTRGLQTYLFYVDAKQRGREYAIQQVIYQNGQLIIPSLPSEITTVVIRGQRRLVDGRPVEIVDLEDDADARIEPTMTVDGQTIQP
jgi:membrane fusion protein (multidrug efflux system)